MRTTKFYDPPCVKIVTHVHNLPLCQSAKTSGQASLQDFYEPETYQW